MRKKSGLDYSTFGAPMPGRTFSSAGYRYGFNGKEKQDELHDNNGDAYDFGARIYDARLGRWLSCDPLQSKYPDLGPYIYCGNTPTKFVDYNGKDYGLLVDHNTDPPTITVKANYYCITDKAYKQMQSALAEINNVQKSVVIDGVTYAVRFDLKAVPPAKPTEEEITARMTEWGCDRATAESTLSNEKTQNAAIQDAQGNLYLGTVGRTVPITTKGTKAGYADKGKVITMYKGSAPNSEHPEFQDTYDFGNYPEIVAHEVFHTLGLSDEGGTWYPEGVGRMTYTGNTGNNFDLPDISENDIVTVLKYAIANDSNALNPGAKVSITQLGQGDLKKSKSITPASEEPKAKNK